MSTASERLAGVIDFLKSTREVYTAKDFAHLVGVPNTFVSEAKTGKKTITPAFAEKIELKFPHISSAWLLTGEGSMLKTTDSVDSSPIESPLDELVDERYFTYLLPLSAQGGSFNEFTQAVTLADCERVRVPISNVDFAIRITGDSMAPEYPNGSQALIKKINERAFIEWGRVYVLDTCNGTVIKKLMPTDDKDVFSCLSINPEYPPFNVSLEDVYGIYRVLMCMSLK